MTEDKAVKIMREIAENVDIEARHGEADDLIVDFLSENNFQELAKVYKSITDDSWYA